MAQSRSLVRAAGDPLVGTSPTDLRLAHAVGFARAAVGAWGVRPGVLWGGTVSGTAGWAYSVAPAALALVRGALEGVYPAAITGAQTAPTDPAPASGSRIDIVYVLQPDIDLGDTGNVPVLAVAKGTASGSPSAPALPTGAMELGRATITSLMTQTLDATVATTAPITALAGGMYQVPSFQQLSRIVSPLELEVARVGTTELYIYQGGSWRLYWQASGSVVRRQVLTGTAAFVPSGSNTVSAALAIVDHSVDGSRTVTLQVDGSSVPYVSGAGSVANWGSVATGLAPPSDVPVTFSHSTNMGLGQLLSSRVLRMQWGSFNSAGTSNVRATATYLIPAP